MRPLGLTIEGLRSFRSAVSLDFHGRNHIAIVGDTGAGKSSILEAMTYALYGRTTFTGRAGQELMNDTSTRMRVVLRFRVSGETWEVVRSVRRRKRMDQVSAQLTRIGDDDAPIESIEQVRRVNERVEQLLGLDCEAFLRTVILPQGRFARLLVEDEPRERSAILRQVWRTDELEAAGEQADKAHRTVRELRIGLDEAAKAHPEDPETHLRHLQTRLDDATRRAVAAGRDESEAEQTREALQAAGQQAATAARVRQRLGAPELDAIMTELGPVSSLAKELAEQARELDRSQKELETRRDAVPARDGPTSEEVAAALATLGGLDERIASAERAAAALRDDAAAAAKRRAEAEQAKERAAAAGAATGKHASGRPPLELAVREAGTRRDAVETNHATVEARAAEREDASQRLGNLRDEEIRIAGELPGAREHEARARREAEDANTKREAARRGESAAHAARGLHPGDPCPVCRRELPDGWNPPAETDLGASERLAETAEHAANEAARAVTGIEGELRSVRKQATAAESGVSAAERRLAEATRDLADAAGLEPGAGLPGRDVLLAPFAAREENARAALQDHARAAERLGTEASRRDTEAQVARRDAGNAERTAETSRRAAAGRLDELGGALRDIPTPFRPALTLPEDAADLRTLDMGPVGAKLEAARSRESVLKARQGEVERLRRAIRDKERSRQQLGERRRLELEAPLGDLAQRLGRQRDALVESARQLGLDRPIPPADAADTGALEAHAQDLDAARGEFGEAAKALAENAAAADKAARARFQVVAERLGEPADDPEAVLRRAGERAEDARHDQRNARNEVERFAAVAGAVRRLRTLLDEVEEKERALGDLAQALKSGRFLKWLTLRRSRKLLVYASRTLEEVSGGRYAFVDPQETDEQWRLLDHESGVPRSPRSLSGGEQFLASLSLALGMVEMMARTGGRLESLFLDEGFGSLDARNLDAAIQALETAAARRMVAVISHVRAVAEQIEDVLAVTRETTGSRATWLSAREREQMAVTDAETAALAGLLE